MNVWQLRRFCWLTLFLTLNNCQRTKCGSVDNEFKDGNLINADDESDSLSDYPNQPSEDDNDYQSDSYQTPQEYNHDEREDKLKRLKNCGKYDLCHGRSNKDFTAAPLYQDTLDKMKCFCDDECQLYGDCCIDMANSDNTSLLNGYRTQDWGCIPIDPYTGVYGIRSCEGDLAQLCLKTNSSNMYTDVPVYSSNTHIVFANVFCALCHRVDPSHIVYANINISCDHNYTLNQLKTLQYKSLSFFSKLEHKVARKGKKREEVCIVQFTGLPENIRYCRPSIHNCSSELHPFYHYCHEYSLPVIDFTNAKVYKNPHCAVCNGAELRYLKCSHMMTGRFTSLSAIMNIDWGFTECQLPSSVWNSRIEQCVHIDCIDGFCDNPSFEYSKDSTWDTAEGYLTAVVLFISVGFLSIHIVIYYLEPKRQNVPSQILTSLSWSLIFGHVSFLMTDLKDLIPFVVCKFIGFSTQFFYLSSFFWMNVMSFDVWKTFSKVTLRGSSSSIIRKYNWYCWGSSSIIVILTIIFDLTRFLPDNYRPEVGLLDICWFTGGLSFIIYYFLPSMLLLLANLYFFGKTVYWFQCQSSKEFEKVNNEATGRKEYRKVWLYIKLYVIMGLTWLTCIISNLTDNEILKCVFILLNGFQGTFIFIMFDTKKRIFHEVIDKFSRTNSTTTTTEVKQLQTTMTRNDSFQP